MAIQPLNLRRVVVKVGTTTLTDADGNVDRDFIKILAKQLAQQASNGREVLLVTSGAIRAGRERLELSTAPQPSKQAKMPSGSRLTLPMKQAAAAIGQGLLMHTYTEAFNELDVVVGQVLLTREDLS